jgi:predicted metal-dependent hydrolase
MAEPLRTEPLPYAVRRSDRARRIRVAVEHDGRVVVTLPQRARERDAAAAVVELRGWIDRRRDEAAARRAALAGTPGTVPYLGTELRLVAEPGRTRVHRRGDTLLVPAGEAAGAAVERFYRRVARAEIAPRVDVATAAVGHACTKLTIRAQRTRWGSR